MLFIETDIFTAGVRSLLSDEEYQRLQLFLAVKPDCGDTIPDTGGLRKVRWLAQGRGKRGGVRIIYFYRYAEDEIRLLLIYRKGVKDDLSAQEKAMLRKLNAGW
ncbi:type II toxin-antitoxin system RelE/ParE family toxin [Siccibacter turicensis]|uniref:Toxin HigB-2 n=1 Tax=Siccibacter turicensis TaxID=357233 RepID=A0A2P8VID9_9ENTR|nr:type II toxin-antitoxin system RelE/ParE family toxin [Siccibacter turicensis]PSN07286.1 toxin HigB-2 [Siccibacter turicensis]